MQQIKQRVELKLTRTGHSIGQNVTIARSFWARTKGLLGHSQLLPGQGLLIPHCQMVHMFGMRFAIDVIFCSSANQVIALQPNLQPWRTSLYARSSDYVIELPTSSIASSGVRCGDYLTLNYH